MITTLHACTNSICIITITNKKETKLPGPEYRWKKIRRKYSN